MAYDPTDPRSRLAATAGDASLRASGVNLAPQFFEFGDRLASETTAGDSPSWWVRSQAIVVNLVEASPGEIIERADQVDEYVVLVPEPGTRLSLTSGADLVTLTGPAVALVPPGTSSIRVDTSGAVYRFFAAATAADLCRRCVNDDFYATADPNVAAFVPWPEPPEGHRIRTYGVADVAPDPERFGRIYRCTTMMINWMYPEPGPRDPSRMSPHHHDDFEQLSLQLVGDYVHHIRTPWSVDMQSWRSDVHRRCTSPSVTVIPPPAIHTSQAVDDGTHQLVDIFCPPRADFSDRPGWVLNAADYPAPSSSPG